MVPYTLSYEIFFIDPAIYKISLTLFNNVLVLMELLANTLINEIKNFLYCSLSSQLSNDTTDILYASRVTRFQDFQEFFAARKMRDNRSPNSQRKILAKLCHHYVEWAQSLTYPN